MDRRLRVPEALMADDWRKKFKERTVKTRTSSANWLALRIVHSNALTMLILGTAALFAVVLHVRGRARDGEFFAIAIAVPWILAAYRHSRSCKPCPRQSGGG
ncbi:hypothetical protein [Embleya hyalina]|nr:hypothetical protein [Embleya hyalina]